MNASNSYITSTSENDIKYSCCHAWLHAKCVLLASQFKSSLAAVTDSLTAMPFGFQAVAETKVYSKVRGIAPPTKLHMLWLSAAVWGVYSSSIGATPMEVPPRAYRNFFFQLWVPLGFGINFRQRLNCWSRSFIPTITCVVSATKMASLTDYTVEALINAPLKNNYDRQRRLVWSKKKYFGP